MLKPEKRKVAIVTGPTGGHFFPGLAVAEKLSADKKTDICFFVPEKKYIAHWLKKKSFRYVFIPAGRLSSRDILSPLKFFYAFAKAMVQLSSGRFNAVFITGSYITVPFLLAAKLCNIKVLVHEQNCRMGKVTKLSKYMADKIAITFPCRNGISKRKISLSGFPLLSDFTKEYSRGKVMEELGFSQDRLTVLVLGGSQGADFLNKIINENIRYLSGKPLQFIHLTGNRAANLQVLYNKFKIPAAVFPFYFDMAKLYSIADMAICRAGAGTLAEISFWKMPAVVVPYPHAGFHQEHNALFFSSRGSCRIFAQKNGNLKNFPGFFENFLKDRTCIKKSMDGINLADCDGKTASLIMLMLCREKK